MAHVDYIFGSGAIFGVGLGDRSAVEEENTADRCERSALGRNGREEGLEHAGKEHFVGRRAPRCTIRLRRLRCIKAVHYKLWDVSEGFEQHDLPFFFAQRKNGDLEHTKGGVLNSFPGVLGFRMLFRTSLHSE